ncbi:hypothetical protein J31TS4_38820 [Paenibacillus sp. J31TS4]|uniref:hypothetical protein n=1 Tax=Paenibacillus sp. J31TS4 TaxID=2807195 RepID=UPI001B1BF154|nr:hypothetical protein [Paenibacillus sp. J31TS4]GIP40602.1 hypothetical protein J31TS4_38820 [Paenibacillus sp. J31TS4]
MPHPIRELDLIGKIADLKEQHYRNTVVLSAVLELLQEKNLISRQEIAAKAAELDAGDQRAASPFIPGPTYPTR